MRSLFSNVSHFDEYFLDLLMMKEILPLYTSYIVVFSSIISSSSSSSKGNSGYDDLLSFT